MPPRYMNTPLSNYLFPDSLHHCFKGVARVLFYLGMSDIDFFSNVYREPFYLLYSLLINREVRQKLSVSSNDQCNKLLKNFKI